MVDIDAGCFKIDQGMNNAAQWNCILEVLNRIMKHLLVGCDHWIS